MSASSSPIRHLCVFCGSSAGEGHRYLAAVTELGTLLARKEIGLVYGGSRTGTMGRLAEAVLEHGGVVIGVIPRPLMDRELAHPGLSRLIVTDSMHERKAQMAALSDAFIAAPGGLGTLEEFFEMATWAQLGFHRKPCGILDVDGFYRPLVQLLDRGVKEGFIQETHRRMILVDGDPEQLVDLLFSYSAPPVPRWIGDQEI
ncbi:MAG: TIGR00730 family Rossman fold protein [Gemmatimonadota bacterium]